MATRLVISDSLQHDRFAEARVSRRTRDSLLDARQWSRWPLTRRWVMRSHWCASLLWFASR